MTQDVRQWLAEIKALQQKLTEAQQEQDDAQKSAANWRSLYETEARQRRTEAKLAQQKIDLLQAELNALKANASPIADSSTSLELDRVRVQTVQQQVSQLDTIEALQNRLTEALLEHDRLKQALQSEQAAHQQTRVELTAALGDAIDYLQGGSASHRLTQERTRSQDSSKPEDFTPTEPPAVLPPKTPSLELPQFD
jgi:DNA repair exonuclease SbcCD ATPase subunit